jgi:hypothetical protein
MFSNMIVKVDFTKWFGAFWFCPFPLWPFAQILGQIICSEKNILYRLKSKYNFPIIKWCGTLVRVCSAWINIGIVCYKTLNLQLWILFWLKELLSKVLQNVLKFEG